MEQMMLLGGVMLLCSVMLIKSASLLGLIISLESLIFVYWILLVMGGLNFWGSEVLLLMGVSLSVVVLSLILGVYIVSFRGASGKVPIDISGAC